LTSWNANALIEMILRSNIFIVHARSSSLACIFFFSSRRRHTRSVSAFLLNRSSDLEHGTMFTLALVRFPPTATKEIQYLNAKGALTYTDIAGDPVLYGNLPPREISMKDVFRSGDSSKKFKIAEGQWYRYAP